MGTVYRNLNQLAENGIILKLSVQSGSDRFDGRTDTHIHVVCKECGAVEDLPYELTTALCENIENTTGFVIKNENIVLQGLCHSCKCKDHKAENIA